ncbi:fimbria/pilus outer membrane usher protein [Serratia fonticola]|uniref:fimbria/pilus outer membrane usher protein n=1 Tax=Serratia fonticola TaxID=47917 RepID=UPI0021AD5912|nr:fimbria/pilus outer membrane usher protein [Serratia fonticola]
MNGINKITVAIFVSLLGFSKLAQAIEFNLDVLDAEDRSNVDLSRFSQVGYVMPGRYIMAVYLNEQNIADREQTIPFYADPQVAKSSTLCFPAALVERLGLTAEAASEVTFWHQEECADFSALHGLTLKGDITSGTLYISAPQALLEYSDPNWLPPSRWDNGIPGLLLDYSLNATTSKAHQGGTSKNASLSGTAGVNIGPWRFRGDYQGNYEFSSATRQAQRHFDWSRWYAYRALPRLNATLTLGENYFYSDIFDSFRFTGVGLASDERMLPPNLRGYAPEVRGIAKTNATVTVSQQGRVIYETTVASGPFRIRDLNRAVSGRLDVRVNEQDGTQQTFTVDTANVPYLTRPGTVRYKNAVGRPSTYQHDIEGPLFGSGEFSWGVANDWSLYGGAVGANNYQAFSLGLGRNLFMLGALSADVTQSIARLPQREGGKKGKSYRLSYSKRFDEFDSEVTFAGYRFSERDYMSMGQYLDARFGGSTVAQSKEMYTITANKSFTDAQLSLYATYTHQSYWDRQPEDSYSLSVSRYFDFMGHRDLSLNVSASRSQYQQRYNDTVFVSLSVPLGSGQSLGYSGQSSNNRLNQALSYTNNIDINNNYRVAAGVNNLGRQQTAKQVNGYYTHRGDNSDISLNAAYVENGTTSAGLSMQGGLTATVKGAALHPAGMNGGTRLMLSTEGIADVPIEGGLVRSNRFGIAVLANVNSYYRTDTRVDINQLADDVEVSKGVVESTLTEGAIGYRRFSLLKGEKALAIIALPGGKHPPFGASVVDQKGRELAIVSDGGLAYLSGITAGDVLNVNWNGAHRCQVALPEKILAQGNLLLPCHVVK